MMFASRTFYSYPKRSTFSPLTVVSSLGTGGRIIAYDGSPFAPNPQAFLKLVSDQGYVILIGSEVNTK